MSVIGYEESDITALAAHATTPFLGCASVRSTENRTLVGHSCLGAIGADGARAGWYDEGGSWCSGGLSVNSGNAVTLCLDTPRCHQMRRLLVRNGRNRYAFSCHCATPKARNGPTFAVQMCQGVRNSDIGLTSPANGQPAWRWGDSRVPGLPSVMTRPSPVSYC